MLERIKDTDSDIFFLCSKAQRTVCSLHSFSISISHRGKQQGLCDGFICRFFPRCYETPVAHQRQQHSWKRSDVELRGSGVQPGSQLPAAFIRHHVPTATPPLCPASPRPQHKSIMRNFCREDSPLTA